MKEVLNSQVSRRELLIKSGQVGTGLAGFVVFGACGQEGGKDTFTTWVELEKEFADKPLNLETARNVILPLAASDYVKYSGTNLTEQELINVVSFEPIENPDELGEAKAREYIKIDTRTFTGESEIIHPLTGEVSSKLVRLRSNLYHEFFHFDVTKTQNTNLIPIVLPPDGSTVLEVEAFSLRSRTGKIFLRNFNERITDVLACHVAKQSGLEYVVNRQGVSQLEEFLKLKNISPDLLIPHYRNSGIEAAAVMLGQSSNLPLGSPLVAGIQVMIWSDEQNWLELKKAFPDNAQIFDAPPRFICK